jgi:hypothetical protein
MYRMNVKPKILSYGKIQRNSPEKTKNKTLARFGGQVPEL